MLFPLLIKRHKGQQDVLEKDKGDKPYLGVKYGLFYVFSFPLISSPPPFKLVPCLPFCLVTVNLFKGFA